jgi:probable rRNA maturation factor
MAPPRLELAVQYGVSSPDVPSRAQFRRWVRKALDREARITIRVVGQAEGRALNRSFRGKDYATNVLTFIFRERAPFEGDLAICAPVVAREAREQSKSLVAHYAHLTVHGVLHLQGYDHDNDVDAAAMETLETEIVTGLGYPDPYALERRAPRTPMKPTTQPAHVRPR